MNLIHSTERHSLLPKILTNAKAGAPKQSLNTKVVVFIFFDFKCKHIGAVFGNKLNCAKPICTQLGIQFVMAMS
jgi:hypothetical protein